MTRPAVAAPPLSSVMPLGFQAPAPPQWADYLARHPERDGPPEEMVLTHFRWRELGAVNADGNAHLYEAEVRDVWDDTLPGDCENIALWKRRLLADWGWPWGALRLAAGDGHAVLSVWTDLGAYLLDNLAGAVVPWWEASRPLRACHRQGLHWNLIFWPESKNGGES